nr:hypothetical protein [Tanacetum cinerariifolium]
MKKIKTGEVAEKIREVAYRLELLNSSQIHLVFHILQLKICHGKYHNVGVLPQLREYGLLENKPMAILERRLGKVNNKPVMFVLIRWTNKSVKEDKESLRRMELMRAKLEVNTAGLKKLVLLAGETLASIQAEDKLHSIEIASLKREEGTSQPSTNELTFQLRPHPEPNNTPYGKLIRIEFLKFTVDDMKDWVYRCKQFFKMDGVPDGRKIQLAFMHMFDVALVWYQQYVKKYPDNTLWEHFEVEVVKRFGVFYDDLIMELKNLKQTGSVQHYQGVFEDLLNKVDLPEPIAMSMFIGGLKREKFIPSHKCSGQLHSIEVIAESVDNYIDGNDETNEDCVGDMVKVTDSPQITLNALSGLNSYQTMRVRGRVGGCGMALGIQCLATLGDIQCNFKKLIMKFNHQGRQLVLTGITNTQVHWMQGNKGMMKQAKLSSRLCMCIQHSYVKWRVLELYLQRYPPNQKDAIEGMVKELMDSGVIKASQSPFSSLIVMVKKKDVFFKLDLRYGYHQIRMKEDDISKTAFRTHEGHYEFLVKYLGHIILTQDVSTNPSKIEAIQKWPIALTLKQLRGFLGLTGYYRRFIKDYASISQPLVALTNKYAFKWNPSAELAYHKLKEAMIKSPVLSLPNFEQEFVVETDASGKGIGAVLYQNGHPIAYWSKTLSIKNQALSTYEKEFLAVVVALDKWKGYLLDRHFKIKTDHFSLKYLLNQKLTTPFQFKWLPKLLGYDYEIVYKKGSKNVVADALSRDDSSGELLQIITGEILKRKGRVVVGNDPELSKELVQDFHNEAIGGHSGAHMTMNKLGQKPDLTAYPGLIQLLPIPERNWKKISMDFIEKLPTSHGKSVILVDKESLRRMELMQAKLEVNTAGLKKLVLLAGVSTTSRSASCSSTFLLRVSYDFTSLASYEFVLILLNRQRDDKNTYKNIKIGTADYVQSGFGAIVFGIFFDE